MSRGAADMGMRLTVRMRAAEACADRYCAELQQAHKALQHTVPHEVPLVPLLVCLHRQDAVQTGPGRFQLSLQQWCNLVLTSHDGLSAASPDYSHTHA